MMQQQITVVYSGDIHAYRSGILGTMLIYSDMLYLERYTYILGACISNGMSPLTFVSIIKMYYS